MLLPIKLATEKQPAKKQKVQKDLGLVITPEMQKNIEATNPQGIVEQAKRIEAVRAEQEQFWKGIKQGEAQLAYEQTLKQAAQQPKQAKAFVPKLQELEKQISPPPVSREVVMQKRVPKTPEGLATISILTDYGTTSYTATPEETQILEFGTIDEGAALRNRLRQEAQAEFANQGLKKKRQTAQAYVTDKVNAVLNPNFVDEQVAETLRAELDDTIFDFAAKYSAGGKLLKTGRDALKSASTKLKNVDDVGAQVTAGLIDSIINPVSSFATATANVYDPTATQEERVGAAGNIALYALGALPVTEAVGASVRAFKTGADVAEGLSLAARSLLRSTAPGRFIDRKITINDLVNVLERNGQMGGKTRGQLAKEFASGGKAFAKATGQAPELFYNKYLNDLADQAQPATPAQFDVTAPKAPEDVNVSNFDSTRYSKEAEGNYNLEFNETPGKYRAGVISRINTDTGKATRGNILDTKSPGDINYLIDNLRYIGEVAPDGTLLTFHSTNDPSKVVKLLDKGILMGDRGDDLGFGLYGGDIKQWGDRGNVQIPLAIKGKLFDMTDLAFGDRLGQSEIKQLVDKGIYGGFTSARGGSPQVVIWDKRLLNNFEDLRSQYLPEAPTQVEDLGTVVDELVGKTEPVVAEPQKEPWQMTRQEFLGEGVPAYKGLSKINWKTNQPIQSVDATQIGKKTAGFFSSDKAVAEKFAKTLGLPESTQLAEARIKFNRPYEIDAQGRPAKDFMTDALNPANNNPELVKALESPDYDGLIIRNTSDEGTIYVPKTAEQIRADITHRASIEQALAEGKLVPANVLADYPDLAFTTPPTSIVDEIEQGMGASKSTAPPPPTEPTVTGIPEMPDEQLTSAKNQMTQEVRDEYDMGKFDEPTRRAWEESLTNAKQELQSNANAVDNVIAKVESKQAINEAEQSVLVVALSRERRNARALLEQTNNATSPEEIATLTEQTKIAEDRIDNYTNALNRAGSETARTLNARRAIIDAAEDLVSIRAKARQTYGKTLEAADEEAINEIGTGLEDINKQIDDATGKGTTPIETVKANTRVKGIKKSAPKLQPKADTKRVKQFEAIVNRVKEKLDAFARPSTIETMGVPTEVDIWQPRLNDPASQAYFKQLASVQNDMGKVIQKLVTDEAIEDFDILLTRLQADGFNITDTDLKLILSADYPTTKLYDFSDIEKEYVKMVRRQLAQEAKGSSVAERGRLIKKIQDLSQKLQSNVRKATDKTLKTAFEENIDLQNRLDDLQAESNVKGQIDKLKEQIADPVLVDRIQREVPQNVQDLVHQREILRGQLNDKLRELADKKFREEHPYLNALEVAAKVPTELLVSLDNSAAFTHGAFRSIRNPLKWTKATSKSFQALISDGKYKDILASVRTRDNYDDMVRAGVAGIKQRDLQDATMYASVLQKVPYLGSLFKRSNAAMEVFGAVIRSDYFDALTEASRKEYLRGKITRSELLDRYKLQAEFVNTVTGKGIKELPRAVSVIAPFANFGMSRIKTATMTPFFNAIAKGDKVAARQFATEFFKYVSTYMGALKVAQMFGLEVGIDPRDPEYFGKIKLPGVDKWWDMSGGILEPYRILINTKPVRNVTGAEESKYKTITNFAEGKLGAPAKTAMNVFQGMTGETPYGKNYDVRTDEGRLNVLMDNLPINVKTGKEVVESDKSLGAKAAEAGLQFMGARLTKDKGSKARQPVTPGVIP